jgi:UDP-glucose 4-epimerase
MNINYNNSILLTGGNGYIGNHLYNILLNKYKNLYNIIVYDLNNNNDLCDFTKLDMLFKKNNIIYVYTFSFI